MVGFSHVLSFRPHAAAGLSPNFQVRFSTPKRDQELTWACGVLEYATSYPIASSSQCTIRWTRLGKSSGQGRAAETLNLGVKDRSSFLGILFHLSANQLAERKDQRIGYGIADGGPVALTFDEAGIVKEREVL
jgi:hypothetical protein